jgi:hypothetical protein
MYRIGRFGYAAAACAAADCCGIATDSNRNAADVIRNAIT